MPRLTIVTGLPGAGKTTLIEQLQSENSSIKYVASDYMKDSIDHRPEMRWSQHHEAVVCSLRNGKDCVIGDIEFLRQPKQEEIEETIQAEVPAQEIHWIVFENDWEQCICNIVNRANGDRSRVEDNFRNFFSLSKAHHVPPNAVIQKVWRPN